LLASRAVARGAGTDAVRETKASVLSRPAILGAVAALVLLALAFGLAWNAAIWPLNQQSEKALARRAQLFWDLRISGDSLGAYQYMMEAYRRRVDATGFARAGGLVIWTGAEVKDVTLDEKGGLVDLEVRYRVAKGRISELESSNVVRERWVLENGEWYRWPPEMGG
jgi:hypothetical protein